MATPRSILTRALRSISYIGQGQTPNSSEIVDALQTANEFLAGLNREYLMLFRDSRDTFTWASGNSTRTIGATGNITTITRPDRIKGMSYMEGDNEIPVRILDDFLEYREITLKTTTSGQINVAFYDPTFPNGTIYAYPVPDEDLTIWLYTWARLSSFGDTGDLDTAVSYPDGYERFLHFNLAKEFVLQFGVSLAPVRLQMLMNLADQTKAQIKSLNIKDIRAIPDYASRGGDSLRAGGSGYDIISDSWFG